MGIIGAIFIIYLVSQNLFQWSELLTFLIALSNSLYWLDHLHISQYV